MRKRIEVLFLTAVFTFSSVPGVFGTEAQQPETAEESIIETDMTEETDDGYGVVSLMDTWAIEGILNDSSLYDKIMSLDTEVIKEDIIMLDKIWNSESFQSLIQYEEVRELIAELIKKGSEFAFENPELVRKILVTLEIDESVAYVVMALLEANGKDAEDLLRELSGTEEGENLYRELVDLLLDGETKEILDGITEQIESF